MQKMEVKTTQNETRSILDLLDEMRSIAQLGLNYTKDKYDLQRYNRLLKLACLEYAKITDLTEKIIVERFKKELGHITPKVGVNGAVFSKNGKILLEKRSDDGLWGVPGGWAEIGESPQESTKRELREETGLEIEVKEVVDIFTRLPGMYSQPHTSYHILFYCEIICGQLISSPESREIGFY
ncbi:MAG: NUDIX hydrolase N-terminal domain-containing protein, partial [Candidatus Hodarchaeota archaeon]